MSRSNLPQDRRRDGTSKRRQGHGSDLSEEQDVDESASGSSDLSGEAGPSGDSSADPNESSEEDEEDAEQSAGEDDSGEDEGMSEGGSDMERSSLDGGAGGRKERHGARRAEPEIQQINKRTNKAEQQKHEGFEGPETLPNIKPMMELEAGRNIWYQAYVLKESLNEVKVRFPHPDGPKRPDLSVTWVCKSSSRIWRGSYANGDWQHLGKGAWKPREKPRRNKAGSRHAKGSAGGAGSGRRGAAGKSNRSDGGGNWQQRKKMRSRTDDDDDFEGSEEERQSSEQEGSSQSDSQAEVETSSAKQPHHQVKQQPQKASSAPNAPRSQQQRQQQRQQHHQRPGHRQSAAPTAAAAAGVKRSAGRGGWASDQEHGSAAHQAADTQRSKRQRTTNTDSSSTADDAGSSEADGQHQGSHQQQQHQQQQRKVCAGFESESDDDSKRNRPSRPSELAGFVASRKAAEQQQRPCITKAAVEQPRNGKIKAATSQQQHVKDSEELPSAPAQAARPRKHNVQRHMASDSAGVCPAQATPAAAAAASQPSRLGQKAQQQQQVQGGGFDSHNPEAMEVDDQQLQPDARVAAAAGGVGSGDQSRKNMADDDDVTSVKSTHSDLQAMFASMAGGDVTQPAATARSRSSRRMDPLAKWFLQHYAVMARSGRLTTSIFAPNCCSLEAGRLPVQFGYDASSGQVQPMNALRQQARNIMGVLPAPLAAAAAATLMQPGSNMLDGGVAAVPATTATGAAAAAVVVSSRGASAAVLPSSRATAAEGAAQVKEANSMTSGALVAFNSARQELQAPMLPSYAGEANDTASSLKQTSSVLTQQLSKRAQVHKPHRQPQQQQQSPRQGRSQDQQQPQRQQQHTAKQWPVLQTASGGGHRRAVQGLSESSEDDDIEEHNGHDADGSDVQECGAAHVVSQTAKRSAAAATAEASASAAAANSDGAPGKLIQRKDVSTDKAPTRVEKRSTASQQHGSGVDSRPPASRASAAAQQAVPQQQRSLQQLGSAGRGTVHDQVQTPAGTTEEPGRVVAKLAKAKPHAVDQQQQKEQLLLPDPSPSRGRGDVNRGAQQQLKAGPQRLSPPQGKASVPAVSVGHTGSSGGACSSPHHGSAAGGVTAGAQKASSRAASSPLRVPVSAAGIEACGHTTGSTAALGRAAAAAQTSAATAAGANSSRDGQHGRTSTPVPGSPKANNTSRAKQGMQELRQSVRDLGQSVRDPGAQGDHTTYSQAAAGRAAGAVAGGTSSMGRGKAVPQSADDVQQQQQEQSLSCNSRSAGTDPSAAVPGAKPHKSTPVTSLARKAAARAAAVASEQAAPKHSSSWQQKEQQHGQQQRQQVVGPPTEPLPTLGQPSLTPSGRAAAAAAGSSAGPAPGQNHQRPAATMLNPDTQPTPRSHSSSQQPKQQQCAGPGSSAHLRPVRPSPHTELSPRSSPHSSPTASPKVSTGTEGSYEPGSAAARSISGGRAGGGPTALSHPEQQQQQHHHHHLQPITKRQGPAQTRGPGSLSPAGLSREAPSADRLLPSEHDRTAGQRHTAAVGGGASGFTSHQRSMSPARPTARLGWASTDGPGSQQQPLNSHQQQYQSRQQQQSGGDRPSQAQPFHQQQSHQRGYSMQERGGSSSRDAHLQDGRGPGGYGTTGGCEPGGGLVRSDYGSSRGPGPGSRMDHRGYASGGGGGYGRGYADCGPSGGSGGGAGSSGGMEHRRGGPGVDHKGSSYGSHQRGWYQGGYGSGGYGA